LTSEGSLTARTGRLLVATPALLDPTFKRTVVLLCAYEQEGTFGVVLNRPLESDVLDHLPAWRHVAASPAVIFEGGPVGLDGALGVGRIGATPPAEGWTGVAGSVGLLARGAAPPARPPRDVRGLPGGPERELRGATASARRYDAPAHPRVLTGGAVVTDSQFGRLDKVDVREHWPDEARDFTPWLAEE